MESPIVHSTTAAGSSRKRPRENETESQRQKREKAAERQRRKRERDRNNNQAVVAAQATVNTMAGLIGFSPNDPHQHHHHLLQQQHPPPPPQSVAAPPVQVLAPSPAPEYQGNPDGLTPDELARRDRVRAAARERQRKHRMMVKQRKLRELGLDMSGNEIVPGAPGSAEEMHHHYQHLAQDLQYPTPHPHPQPPPPPPPPPPHAQMHEQHHHQQFPGIPGPPGGGGGAGPQAPGPGGQTFASTLLLSFSCAPLLKQHLLRTLHMSNEELASLEPILAEAWERWDHARRAHYAEQAAKAGLPPPIPYPISVDPNLSPEQQQAQLAAAAAAAAATFQQQQQQVPPTATTTGTPGDPSQPNEFRERFQRSLVAPAPFRSSFNGNGNGGGGEGSVSVSTPTSASGSTTSGGEAIDPQLAGPSSSVNGSAVEGVNGAGAPPPPPPTSVSAAVKKGRKRG